MKIILMIQLISTINNKIITKPRTFHTDDSSPFFTQNINLPDYPQYSVIASNTGINPQFFSCHTRRSMARSMMTPNNFKPQRNIRNDMRPGFRCRLTQQRNSPSHYASSNRRIPESGLPSSHSFIICIILCFTFHAEL